MMTLRIDEIVNRQPFGNGCRKCWPLALTCFEKEQEALLN